MRKHPIARRPDVPVEPLTVLCLSPIDEDHMCLQTIIGHTKWKMFSARDLPTALALIRKHHIAVVLCERELQKETWFDLIENVNTIPESPSVIVASRMADEHLWAEALNVGAWDVLAKPFDKVEVIRSVQAAWQRWYDQLDSMAEMNTMQT